MEDFLAELGSDSPAPGGGSVAALSGALAASLCAMVCRITLGKESRASSWMELRDALNAAEKHGDRLRCLVQEDCDAFTAVMEARRLPHATEPARTARKAALQAALIHCAEVPLETLETLGVLATVVEEVFLRGDPSCVTDAASAAAMVRAGARAAAYNVRINLPGILDASVRRGLDEQAARTLESVLSVTGHIDREIGRHLSEGTL